MIKKLKVFIICFAFLLTSVTFSALSINHVSAESGNLIQNATFDWTVKSIFGQSVYNCEGWSLTESEHKKDGDNCYIDFTDNYTISTDDLALNLSAGVTYEFGVSVKSTVVNSVKIFVSSNQENSVVATTGVVYINENTDVWRKIGGIFTPETDCAVTFSILGNNGLSVDDAYLQETEENLKIESGAYLRLHKENKGIKFRGQINKEYFDNLKNKFFDAKVGILIVPKESLEKDNGAFIEFTKEQLDENSKVYLFMEAVIKLETSEFPNDYLFDCAMAISSDRSIKREYVARTMVIYTDGNGNIVTEYSAFDQNINCKSIYEMALKAKAEEEKYTERQREIIDYFCTNA